MKKKLYGLEITSEDMKMSSKERFFLDKRIKELKKEFPNIPYEIICRNTIISPYGEGVYSYKENQPAMIVCDGERDILKYYYSENINRIDIYNKLTKKWEKGKPYTSIP